MICKTCNVEKARIRAEHKGKGRTGFYIYRDERGKKWNGRQCPECTLRATHGPIDEVKNPIHARARKAERKAETFFRDRGYVVQITDNKGPDLIIVRRGKPRKCEVKLVTFHAGSWRVSRVKPNRKADDLMVMVFPNHIRVERMKSHLAKCGKCGGRTVTKYL